MHDLWTEIHPGRAFAEDWPNWEPIIFREADKIFCMTETQSEYYQGKSTDATARSFRIASRPKPMCPKNSR